VTRPKREEPERFLQSEEPGSAELAQILRSGPVRGTLDKLMQSIAEAIGVDYMVLGLRHSNQYEFIATFGVPLAGYSDRVPANRMGPTLFSREVEVPDLQKEPKFVVLDVVSEAKKWRYGVNVPVRLLRPLADDGVLALSGASRQLLPSGGVALAKLRRFADVIADLVWLTIQIRSARTHSSTVDIVSNVLMASVKNSPFPLAIIDSKLHLVGFSPRFISHQRDRMGSLPVPGTPIADAWLDDDALSAVRKIMAEGGALAGSPVSPPGTDEEMQFDFQRLTYNDVPTPFGIIGFYRRDGGDKNYGYGKSGKSGKKGSAAKDDGPNALSHNSDGTGPVSTFLLSTLPIKQRLLKRGSQSYIALRSWRKSIKDHQISALRALKSGPPDAFVETVANEMVETIRSTYGRLDHGVVVPVPCGHSGLGCLSERLAQAVALKLDIPLVTVFECLPVKGSSHPKTNVKRPKMRRTGAAVNGSVILIDDVATSGAHIKEAAEMMAEASAVWPVVWIAD
jgi:hypothetical protein